MSLLSKLMDTMRLNSDEDEEYFGPEDEYEADRPAKRSPFSSRDDGEGYDEGAEDSKPRFFSRSSKVVPMKMCIRDRSEPEETMHSLSHMDLIPTRKFV